MRLEEKKKLKKKKKRERKELKCLLMGEWVVIVVYSNIYIYTHIYSWALMDLIAS